MLHYERRSRMQSLAHSQLVICGELRSKDKLWPHNHLFTNKGRVGNIYDLQSSVQGNILKHVIGVQLI